MTKLSLLQIRHVIILAPILIVLLVISYTCFRWALADIYIAQVKYILENEDDDSTNKNVADWQRAKVQLDAALSLRLNSAGLLEITENFYQTLSHYEVITPTLTKQLYWKDNQKHALEYAEQALLLRPSWAYLWVSMAESKIALNQIDEEMLGAFERAISLGPWQLTVHIDIAQYGLDIWEILSDKGRLVILQAIEQYMLINLQQPDNNTKLLMLHDNLAKACAAHKILPTKQLPNFGQYCKENNMGIKIK